MGNSKFGKALMESQVLAMAHCALVGSAIPMLLDFFLDFIELKLRTKSPDEAILVQFRVRALVLLSNIIATIVYASIRVFGNDMSSFAFLYILSVYIGLSTEITAITVTIMTLGIIPNTILLAGVILQLVSSPLYLICLLSPSHVRLIRIAYWMNNACYLLFLATAFVWGRDLWRRYKEARGKAFQMGTTELICIVYW